MYHINKLIEGSGEYVNLKDTAEYRFKRLQIKGNSTQETTEGYNLYNNIYDILTYGCTVSQENIDNGKKITVNTITNDANHGFYMRITNFLADNANLQDGDKILIKYKIKTTNNSAFPYNFGKMEGTTNATHYPSVDETLNNTFHERYFLCTYNASAQYKSFVFYSPLIALGDVFEIKDVMFCKSSVDLPYEQYTGGMPMPSPDFPSEVETIGSIVNLFDGELVLGSINTTTGENQFNNDFARTVNFIDVNGIKDITIQYENNKVTSKQIVIYQYDSNKTFIKYTAKTQTQYSLTVEENTRYIRARFLGASNGSIEDYQNIKIEKGLIATPYTPPKMGSIGVNVCNANLLPNFRPTTQTKNGIIFTNNGDGTYYLDGTCSAYYNFVDSEAFLLKAGNYTLYGNKNMQLRSNDGLTTYVSTSGSIGGGSKNFTFEKDTEVRFRQIFYSSEVYNNQLIKPMLISGTNQIDFIEHQSQKLPIYLNSELCKIGDYQDYLYKDLNEGKWYKHKEINKYKFTGNEAWALVTSIAEGTSRFYTNKSDVINLENKTPDKVIYSNAFKPMTWHEIYLTDKTTKNGISNYNLNNSSEGRIVIRIDSNIASDVATFKTYLSSNKIYCYYVLGTPIEEEITDPVLIEQYDKLLKLQAFKGETNIYNTDIAILDVAAYKQITNEFIENIINGKPTRGYIKVLANNQYPEIIINENNYLKDFKIEELRYIPEEGFIGGAVCKRVTGNFNNVDNNFTIQDREFELYLGVDLEDGSTEYIKYGTFIVQKPSDDRVTDNTYFEALDYMCKFNQPYVDRITYPCTLKDLFYDVVSQATLETTVDSFANDDFIVENNQFESGATLRDVLKAIAQIAFTWARVDEENYVQLDFEQKEEISEELDENQYYNLETSKEYGPVNTIVIRNSQIEGENVTIKNQKLIDAPAGNQLVDFGNAQITNTADYAWENNVLTVDSTNKADKAYNLVGYNILDLVLNNRGKTLYFKATSLDLSGYTSVNTVIGSLALIIDGKTTYPTVLNKNNASTGWKIPEEGEITLATIRITCNNTSTTGTPSIVKVIEPILSFVENATYEPYIATGPIELVINDNPFAYTQEKRQQLITAGEKMYGLTYTPMKMNMIGMFYLNSKDKIRVKTLNNQYYETYLLDHTIDYTGTVSDNMEAQAKTKTETQYKYTPPLEQQLKHTEVKVDKANQKIQAIIENQTSTNTQVTELNLELGKISASVATKDEVTNQINELQINVENTINKVTTSGGNNIFYTAKEYWHGETEESDASLEVITDTDIKQNTTSGLAYDLNNGVSIQKQTVKNDAYTISFIYNKKLASSTAYVLINNERYDLITSTVNKWNNFVAQVNIDTNSIEIEFVCDSNNGFYVADLMVNIGSEKMVWSQNANETITDTVIIGRGIQVNSSNTKTYTRMDADGNRTFNSLTNERVGEMTSKGIYGNELEVKGQAKVNALLIQKVDNQVWLTGL